MLQCKPGSNSREVPRFGSSQIRLPVSLHLSLSLSLSVMGEEFRSKCQGASRQCSVVGECRYHISRIVSVVPLLARTAPSLLLTVLIPLFSTTAHYAVISLCNFILGLKLIVNLVNWNTTFLAARLELSNLYSDLDVFMKEKKNIFVQKENILHIL